MVQIQLTQEDTLVSCSDPYSNIETTPPGARVESKTLANRIAEVTDDL